MAEGEELDTLCLPGDLGFEARKPDGASVFDQLGEVAQQRLLELQLVDPIALRPDLRSAVPKEGLDEVAHGGVIDVPFAVHYLARDLRLEAPRVHDEVGKLRLGFASRPHAPLERALQLLQSPFSLGLRQPEDLAQVRLDIPKDGVQPANSLLEQPDPALEHVQHPLFDGPLDGEVEDRHHVLLSYAVYAPNPLLNRMGFQGKS